MSRTDKTDPYRVKVDRYGAHYWLPIYRCCCAVCSIDYGHRRARERAAGKRRAQRNWRDEYE